MENNKTTIRLALSELRGQPLRADGWGWGRPVILEYFTLCDIRHCKLTEFNQIKFLILQEVFSFKSQILHYFNLWNWLLFIRKMYWSELNL